jgi:ketosteroid isomerase-like protein
MAAARHEIVRAPLRIGAGSSRTLDQRLAVRFPRLAAAFLRRLGRLPPTSRIRHAALARGLRLAAEAYNRRDLAAVVVGWHRDFEYCPGREWVDSGLIEPCYRGLSGYREYVATTAEVWADEIRFEPTEFVDAGDRIAVLATTPMRAQVSGVALTQTFAYVATLKDGLVMRQQEYYDHAEALEAVGVRQTQGRHPAQPTADSGQPTR